jgi:YVTN family beta-propeller protein
VSVALIVAATAALPLRAQKETVYVPVGTNPSAIAINSVTNRIYVANQGSNNVTVIDGASNSTATISVGTSPVAVAVNPVANRVYVANQGSNTVTVIDGASNSTATIPVGTQPAALAVNATTDRVYVVNQGSGNVSVIDGPTNATTTVAAGTDPDAIAVNPATGLVYVVNYGSNDVTVIDGATNAATTVPVGTAPTDVAVNPVTNKIYVANSYGVIPGLGSVSVIDGATETVATISVETPIAVAVNSVTNKIYVAESIPVSYPLGSVTVIDGATNATTVVPLGGNAIAVAVDPATNMVFVRDLESKGVQVVNGATNDVSNLAVGSDVTAFAVNSATNTIYAAQLVPAGATPDIVFIVDGSAFPVFASEPRSQTVSTGTSVIFSVATSGLPALGYEWSLNGTSLSNGAGVSGALDSTLYLSGVTPASAGAYTCRVWNDVGETTSIAATLTVTGAATPSRLINISCRAQVGTGANQLIVGFVTGGQRTSGSIPLLIRASGPALEQFGVSNLLPDPELQLNIPGYITVTNESWGGSAQIASAASAAGAFAWTDPSSRDSAMLQYLTGGAYTAQVAGASGDTGIALAEIYDITPPGTYTAAVTRLVNVSARTTVGTGSGIAIVGFVVGGTTSETVLIRGSGPALGPFGVSGALPDPKLELYTSNGDGTSTLLASDTGWGGNAQIAAAAASAGAFSWGSTATPDSAILVTLPPGAYTAQLSGASGDTGIGLVEVYEVP